MHSKHLPHIDGIRCLAILPVVLHHLMPSLCPGGFIGVDIFFVVSGYLICGGILKRLEEGRFTFSDFYFRRVRRILPNYFAATAATLAVGVLVYHWGRLIGLAESAFFSTIFSANVYFWVSNGYFQPEAEQSPLRHLWSLGVEEHFYIFIPLLIWLLWRAHPRLVMPGLAMVGFVSLATCLLAAEKGHSTTAFYLSPFRAWELIAGALICKLPAAKRGRASTWIPPIALGTILFSLWAITTEGTFGGAGTFVRLAFAGDAGMIPFPGWVLMPTVLGTLGLIRYGAFGIVGRLLQFNVLVFIGMLSYSIYLWHWPVIVFGKYITYRDEIESPLFALALLAISMALAYVAWRWIEQPTRQKMSVRWRGFVYALGGTAVLLVTAGLLAKDGLRDKIHPEANMRAPAPRTFETEVKAKLEFRKPFRDFEYPRYDENYLKKIGDQRVPPTFCIIGDSHARAIAAGFDAECQRRSLSGLHARQRMAPLMNFGVLKNQTFRWLDEQPQITDVILVARWLGQYQIWDGIPELGERGNIDPIEVDQAVLAEMQADFIATANWVKARGKRVFILTTVPEYGYEPCDLHARSQLFPFDKDLTILANDYRNRQAPVTDIFAKLHEQKIATVMPLGEAMIADDVTVFADEDGRPYYTDRNHLSRRGARFAVRQIAPLIWPDWEP